MGYIEMCSVVPFGDTVGTGGWPYLNDKPLLIVGLLAKNEYNKPAEAKIALTFLADAATDKEAELTVRGPRTLVQSGGKLLAVVDTQSHLTPKIIIGGGSLSLGVTIPAYGGYSCTVYVPGWDLAADQFPESIDRRRLADQYWDDVLKPAMKVSIPDPQLENVIRASQVHCLIAARNEEEGKRIAPWIASDRYGPLESESNSIIRGMMLMGHQDFARRSLDFFIKRYSPEGLLTTGYTLMGTGWHLQALGEYFDLTQDKEWMKSIAPEVERVCNWIVAQRRKTCIYGPHGEKRPEFGLMPPGVGADWNAFAYHFALNGYYCAGLREAAEALDAIGVPSAKELLTEADRFRKDLMVAFHHTMALSPVVPLQDGTWVPWYPGQLHCPGPTGRFFPGEDGNRSWCYDVELGSHHLVPQGVMPADSIDTDWMMNHMEDVQFLADGWFDYPAEKNKADWFNLGGFSKVQPYYTRNAEIYAMRDDVKPFIRSYFNALASLLNTENLTLWEHFRTSGAWNKTHETGYFLQQTRWMFVTDWTGPLRLAPFVPDRWFEDGKVIEISNAPTRYGKVGYRIESHIAQGYIEAVLDLPSHRHLIEVALRIRHPEGKTPKEITIDGKPGARFDVAKSLIIIPGPLKGKFTVRVEY